MSAPLSSHQIQVLALYTVHATKGPVPRHVVETALALCDVNVFQIQEALYILIKNENLTQKYDEDQTEYLFLTAQGRCVIDELCKEAPLSYREKALAFAAVEMTKLRTQIGVEASVVKTEKGSDTDYICNVSISDAGTPLFSLSLYCPNKLQGEMMAERFRKNPLNIYRKILHIMTGTDETTEE